MKKRKAFTLTELIVVIVIIGILAGVLIPSIIGYVEKSKRAKFQQEANQIFNLFENNSILEGESIADKKVFYNSGDYYFIWDGTSKSNIYSLDEAVYQIHNQQIYTSADETYESNYLIKQYDYSNIYCELNDEGNIILSEKYFDRNFNYAANETGENARLANNRNAKLANQTPSGVNIDDITSWQIKNVKENSTKRVVINDTYGNGKIEKLDQNAFADSTVVEVVLNNMESFIEIPTGTFTNNTIQKVQINNVANTTFATTTSASTDYFNSEITLYISETDKDLINLSDKSEIDSKIVTTVAKIGETAYLSVYDAMDASVSYDTIVVTAAEIVLLEDLIIKRHVTLLLPYDGLSETAMHTNESATANLAKKTNNKCNVIVSENTNIIVYGTLYIGGVTSGGGGGKAASGQTSGDFAMITLKENSTITSYGSIICFGFIREDYQHNTSKVLAKSGEMVVPYVVYDFRGGTISSQCVGDSDMPTSPYDVFDMPNIQVETTIYDDTQYIVHANLYASSQNNETDITLISTDKGLFVLNDNSYITINYQLSESEFNDETMYSYTGKTKIDINGGIKFGSLELDVYGVILSTSDYYCPFSYKFDISLSNGLYLINEDIKLMTGTRMTISDDATLEVNADLICYTEYNSDTTGGHRYPEKEPAEFILNGQMIVNGGFAGKISDLSSGSIISFETTKFEVSSYQLALSDEDNKTIEKIEITEKARLDDLTHLIAGTCYIYDSQDMCWKESSNVVKITFMETEFGTNNYAFYEKGSAITLPNPNEKEGYVFDGWYLNEDYSGNPLLSIEADEEISLYAKYSPKQYNVTFVYNNGDKNHTTIISYNDIYSIPTNADPNKVFDGWFYDAECIHWAGDTSKITGDTVLYAKWAETRDIIINGEITIVNLNSIIEIKTYSEGTCNPIYYIEIIVNDETIHIASRNTRAYNVSWTWENEIGNTGTTLKATSNIEISYE